MLSFDPAPDRYSGRSKMKLVMCRVFPYTTKSWLEELVIKRPFFWCAGLGIVGIALLLGSISFAQETRSTSQETDGSVAFVVRVIVTGSNIPTAEEVGPNPVDTYRPTDIEKLGIRNATDLTTFLPQEAGGTQNLNIANGGERDVAINLRGVLGKGNPVRVDGKSVGLGSFN